ncbi:MAG TPA: hypothetical protein VFP35_03485 [Candidatus Saccharimonadales bacterium]|nr:hypothetical protein [Candidatus Saccharimonadales bacterium]
MSESRPIILFGVVIFIVLAIIIGIAASQPSSNNLTAVDKSGTHSPHDGK